MSTALAVLLAVIPSAALLILLAWRDPKRLRSLPRQGTARPQPWPPTQRRALTVGVLLPGALLMAAGLWAAWLIWLGALLAGSWGGVVALAAPIKR
jgi:hypothetical protein